MTVRNDQLAIAYNKVATDCSPILEQLVQELTDLTQRFEHVDRIYGRIKRKSSFLAKVSRHLAEYRPPFSQVEDFIAIRVLVVFPEAADRVASFIKEQFHPNVEDYYKEPPDPNKFGYEGYQIVQSIPRFKVPDAAPVDFPKVFEVQVKTLFMHAWAEAEHLLRYEKLRAGLSVPQTVEKRLAWLAASAWGSDSILTEFLHWYKQSQ